MVTSIMVVVLSPEVAVGSNATGDPICRNAVARVCRTVLLFVLCCDLKVQYVLYTPVTVLAFELISTFK